MIPAPNRFGILEILKGMFIMGKHAPFIRPSQVRVLSPGTPVIYSASSRCIVVNCFFRCDITSHHVAVSVQSLWFRLVGPQPDVP